MKRKVVFFLLLSIAFFYKPLDAQEVLAGDSLFQSIEAEVIMPWFRALKDGNINKIRHHISSDLYNKNRTLLEQNKDYPEFLRNFYSNTNIEIEKTIEIAGDITVYVTIQFPNGHRSCTELGLSKYGEGSESESKKWQIKSISYR